MPGPQLLERAAEVEALEEAVAAACEGTGSVVLLEGPPGVGKTALLRLAREIAGGAGMRLLSGRGTELDRAFAFGTLRELFSGAARETPLEGPAAVARSALGFGGGEQPGEPAAVAHGVYWLLSDLAEGTPVALLIDDLQWVDAASRHVLAHVCARLEELRVVAVVATRPDPAALLELEPVLRGPTTRELRPRPLSAEGVLARAGPAAEPEFASACHDLTGGNPFLLGELLQEMADEGIPPVADSVARVREVAPRAVQRSVLVRVARLPEPARRVARVAAILAPGPDAGLLSELAGVGRGECLTAVRELVDAHVFADDPGLDFLHPVMRASLYQDIPPVEREDLHRRAAAALSARAAEAEAVAVHLLRTAPAGDPRVVATLKQAGAAAFAAGAPEAAEEYLARAAAEPPPPEDRAAVTGLLGRVQAALGRAAAVGTLRDAFAAGDADQRADVAADLAESLAALEGDGAAAVAVLWEALDGLPETDDRRWALLSALMSVAPRFAVTMPDLTRALALVPPDLAGETPAQCECMISACSLRIERGATAEQIRETVGRALSHNGATGGPAAEQAQLILRACGELEWADRLAAANIARLEARGLRMWVVHATHEHAFALLAMGRLAEAEALTASAWRMLPDDVSDLERVLVASCHARVLIPRGRLEEAEELIAGLPRVEGVDAAARVLTAEAMLAGARGDHARAAELFMEAHELDGKLGELHPAMKSNSPEAVFSLVAAGRTEDAAQVLDGQMMRALRFGASGPIGWLTAAKGVVERSPDLLQEGIELLAGGSWRYPHARAVVHLGIVLRLRRHPREARTHLRTGLDLARNMGAFGLAQLAGDELRAAGGRAVDRLATGRDSLTPSELRVATLAAEGATNKQIAQRLFLSGKTVEMHLSNTYRKLDISSRGALADALA